MPVTVGPYTLLGTDAQNAVLQPMAQKMAVVVETRVKPTQVHVLPRDQMPWARRPVLNPDGTIKRKGVRAEGFWSHSSQPGDILLADDLFSRPDHARKTFAHEGAHQLDAQWMLKTNEADIKPLFEPDAAGWPAEPFAVYGSAAVFGFDDPPYTAFYPDAVIPKSEWPKVKAFALRDDHGVTPPPVQPDTCEPMRSQVHAAIDKLDDAIADLDAVSDALKAASAYAAVEGVR